MSQFATRLYDVFLMIAPPEASPLWRWDVWTSVVPTLTPVMRSARGKTSARVHQYNRAGGSPNQSYVRFGQIGWNERSHAKWTHGSPETRDISAQWDFHSVEFWSPGPTICANEDCPPDAFLSIGKKDAYGVIGYAAALAIAQDNPALRGIAAGAFATLARVMRPTLSLRMSRNWGGGQDPESGKWRNAIQDTFFVTGPFKPGRPPSGRIDISWLEGKWEPFEASLPTS